MEAHGASIRIDLLREADPLKRGRTEVEGQPRAEPAPVDERPRKKRRRRLFASRAHAHGVRTGGPAGPADQLMIPPNRAL